LERRGALAFDVGLAPSRAHACDRGHGGGKAVLRRAAAPAPHLPARAVVVSTVAALEAASAAHAAAGVAETDHVAGHPAFLGRIGQDGECECATGGDPSSAKGSPSRCRYGPWRWSSSVASLRSPSLS